MAIIAAARKFYMATRLRDVFALALIASRNFCEGVVSARSNICISALTQTAIRVVLESLSLSTLSRSSYRRSKLHAAT